MTQQAGNGAREGRGAAPGTQAIDRAAAILNYVVGADDPVSFTQVVQKTGLSRSTSSRLLQALERGGLLERNPDGAFRGGPLFTLYASRFDRVSSLAAASGSTLQRISEETGEAVHLAVPSGDRVVQVAQVDSTYLLGAGNWIDIDVPPHCSALGKVLYAYGGIALPTGTLERPTRATLASASSLRADLERVRENGYAVTRGELEEGLDALAAPVFGTEEAVIASIGISGPSLRLDGDHDRLGRLLAREAETLSKSLRRQAAHFA